MTAKRTTLPYIAPTVINLFLGSNTRNKGESFNLALS
jgi:hypothetical protein